MSPMNWRLYPSNWREISRRVREASGGRCQCLGQCGLHRDHPGPRRCEEQQGQPAKWARGKVVLTVAHLDHDPTHNAESNLRAMCNRCHLRYDVAHHQRHAAQTRRARKQTRELFPEGTTP